MKAKEYVELYKRALLFPIIEGTIKDQAEFALVKSMSEEVDQLVKSRNCQSDSAIIAVFKEMQIKMISINRLCSNIPVFIFEVSVKVANERIYNRLMQQNIFEYNYRKSTIQSIKNGYLETNYSKDNIQ